MGFVKKLSLLFVVVLASLAGITKAAPRMVIGELVTNTGCPPCYAADLALDRVVGPDSDFFALIRYHWNYPDPSDPFYMYNTSDNMARNNYYSNNYSPHLWLDGDHDWGYNTGTWSNGIINEGDQDAEIAMSLSGTFDRDSLVGYLHVNIIVETSPGLNNLKLRVALTQSDIHWSAPNGTLVHNQTFRDIFPTTGGLGVTLPVGDTLNYTVRYAIPSPIIADSCELVAFVQSDQNKHIVQGAKIKVRSLDVTGVQDGVELPKSMSLSQNYPNPFNAQTRIDFATAGGMTTLDIYNITGAKVATVCNENLNAGSYSMVWDGRDFSGKTVSSGTYFYRLTDNTGHQTKRMTLLK